jgi:hypothetical protein
MGKKIGAKRPVTATGRRCVVAGCPDKPAPGALICDRHAEILRQPPGDGAA